jgi:hypothetical protein
MLAREFPWLILYRAASWITAALILAGLAAFALSLTRTSAARVAPRFRAGTPCADTCAKCE